MKNQNLVIGCLHAPFHNKKMWNGVLQFIKDTDLQSINLIGDILDLNSLSFHERGKYPLDGLTIKKEYPMVKVFDELDDAIGRRKIKRRFMYGNHEDRYSRHREIPDNDKILCESPEEYFRLRERGYEVKTDWRDDYFKLGDHLEIFHGTLLGVNPAKRQLDKLKKSCMFVHSHRAGVHFDGNMASYNIGCMVDIESPVFKYAPRLIKRNWIMGFGLVTLDEDGYYYAKIITGYRDKFYYNGKKYGK